MYTHQICKRSFAVKQDFTNTLLIFYGDFSIKSLIGVRNLYAFQFTNLFLSFLLGIHLISFKMSQYLAPVATQTKDATTFLVDLVMNNTG